MTRPTLAFQGEYGSNSHELCVQQFPGYEPRPCATFAEAFAAMKAGTVDAGVIAMENSIAGRVEDVYHMLPRAGLRIIGERFKPIHMHLMSNPGVQLAQVRTAASHVMALAQCRATLGRLGIRPEVASDTAGAARALAEAPDPTRAAIAPALAAELYGLTILEREVEDELHNTTRFLLMTADPAPPEPPADVACLTSLVFRARNVPSALYKALGGFASNGVNVSKLESYLEGGQFTAATFYAEFEGRPGDPGPALAMEELAFFCRQVDILGVFEADSFRRRPAPDLAPDTEARA